MTDNNLILEAQKLGFKFHKQPNSWTWSAVSPDGESSITCASAKDRMEWLRRKFTHFMPDPISVQAERTGQLTPSCPGGGQS